MACLHLQRTEHDIQLSGGSAVMCVLGTFLQSALTKQITPQIWLTEVPDMHVTADPLDGSVSLLGLKMETLVYKIRIYM